MAISLSQQQSGIESASGPKAELDNLCDFGPRGDLRFRAEGPQGDSPGQRPGKTIGNTTKAPTGRNGSVLHIALSGLLYLLCPFPGALPQAITLRPVGANRIARRRGDLQFRAEGPQGDSTEQRPGKTICNMIKPQRGEMEWLFMSPFQGFCVCYVHFLGLRPRLSHFAPLGLIAIQIPELSGHA